MSEPKKMNSRQASGLAVGIGALAGLRPMTVSAVIANSAQRGWIDPGKSPFATIIPVAVSGRIAEHAISELIRDKLPFTPSRVNVGPLASRVALGAICGATVCGALRQRPAQGALLGGLGAVLGSFAGHYARRNLRYRMPDVTAGLLEDCVAVLGSALIVARIAVVK